VNEHNHTDEELTRYLLGEMTEAEQMQLEAHYFADPEKFADLCAWRDDLIDRYVNDELSASLRLRFEAAIENAWMTSERIRFAETLQESIEGRGHKTRRASHSVWQSVRAFFVRNR
jgi:anti-sigma factor RsiW